MRLHDTSVMTQDHAPSKQSTQKYKGWTAPGLELPAYIPAQSELGQAAL